MNTERNLFIGLLTKTELQKQVSNGDISARQEKIFFKAVRAFYTRALEYALGNLPLRDEVLQNAVFTNFSTRLRATFSQVEYFVGR